MTRVFLDANVLFSAAWREGSGIVRLWTIPDVQLVTSNYALMEAERNIRLKRPDALNRLVSLAASVEVSDSTAPLSEGHGLPEKDYPILAAAAGSGCTVLLTGDVTHFGHLIGMEVEAVRIMTASMFLHEAAG